ncbi:phospholipase D-like domain-containing protein [Haloferax gibbonsii]|nr:hypothetical protein [Haloferax gibbonsii]
MSEKDDKIKREILKLLYEAFEESPYRGQDGNTLFEELSQFKENDIVYNVQRMDSDYVDNNAAIGRKISTVQITAKGIEEISGQGHPTILDSNIRYNVLDALYNADRQNPGHAYLTRDNLLDEVGSDEDEVDLNVWYLKEKRLVDTLGGGGGLFYHDTKITDQGIKRYEQYVDDGVEIPRSGAKKTFRQASIGPNESGKAENLFRDFVELSRNEIIIIDRYARKPLYDLLKHVPSGVEIKVVTSGRVTGQGYQQRVNQFANQHPEIEVREVSDSDWPFHDRYIIRDREDGWAWGHSFHDAGDTQHTASELRPINRDNIVNQFNNIWQKGGVIV